MQGLLLYMTAEVITTDYKAPCQPTLSNILYGWTYVCVLHATSDIAKRLECVVRQVI